METVTLRNIGKGIGNFFSDLGTAILDFDLSLLSAYAFLLIIVFGTPIFLYMATAKYIKNFKEHRLFFKIIYPIALLGGIYFYFLALSFGMLDILINGFDN
ncbi:MAG: hypothetical protein L7S72_03700 [Flavobacteriales bacterium]|nr:hypothetical protein [Flavobacteriales bacterium]